MPERQQTERSQELGSNPELQPQTTLLGHAIAWRRYSGALSIDGGVYSLADAQAVIAAERIKTRNLEHFLVEIRAIADDGGTL